MSQQIDNQIVKMQFDNASFEKNAQQSMSTLDKLKQALKFDKVNMTPLQSAFAETEATATKAGFHIQDVWQKMSSIIEQEIAQKVVDAGKKMLNALTFEGINDGFKEYELKMGSIQTIMAGTGESLATVNRYLDDLNAYSDQTIYSFADMTQNIGKFTNAGVKLRDAVDAIKGIANEAAVSGANANEASRAMYNFAQALSAGYVKLIDWKSIENANMATKEFKETLLDVAVAMGNAEKTADGMYKILTTNNKGKVMDELVSGTKNFNDSLQYQWMTTEVLTKALKLYATDVRTLTEEEKNLYEQELKNMGLSDEQIEKFEQLGIKATDAASEIKTFSMLMDTVKEAIGSGWAMTWQLIIGDFEQAKALWTEVGKVMDNVIGGMSDARNKFLKAGLQTGWEAFTTMEGKAIPQAEKFREVLVDLARKQNILTKEQYIGINSTETFMKSLHESGWLTSGLLTEAVDDYTKMLESMSEAEIDEFGIKASDVEQMKKLNQELKDGTINADEFVKRMINLGGRENLIQGLRNAFDGLKSILKPIGEAFDNVFGTMDPQKLFQFTENFKNFTAQLRLSISTTKALRDTFTLVFTAIKFVLDTIGTTLSGFGKLVLPVLNIFDAIINIIGKVITGFKQFNIGAKAANKELAEGAASIGDKYLKVMDTIAEVLNKVADVIRNYSGYAIKFGREIGNGFKEAKNYVVGFWREFSQMPVIKRIVDDFNASVAKIEEKIRPLGALVKNTLGGIQVDFKTTFNFEKLNKILTAAYDKFTKVLKVIKDFGGRIKDFFKDLRSGKSLMESFRDNFGDIIDKIKELKDTITDFFEKLFEKGSEMDGKFDLKAIQQSIHDFVSNIKPEQVTMIAVAGTIMLIAINLLRLSEAMKNALDSFTGIGLALKNVINSYIKKQKSAILQVAEAIVIVAAALWVLSTIPKEGLDNAVNALFSIGAVLGILTVVMTAAATALTVMKSKSSLVELATGLVMVSGAFMVSALTLKVLENVNLKGILPKIVVMSLIMTGLVGLSVLMGKLDKFKTGAVTMVAVAGALYIASNALVNISDIPSDKIEKSMETMFKMMIGLAAVTFASGKIGIFSAVGLIAIILTLEKIMPAVEKIVNYDYSNIEKGLDKNSDMLKKMGGILLILTGLGMLAGNRIKGAAIAMLAISATFAILVGVAKLAAQLKPQELKKGEKFLWSMAGIIALIELCSSKSRLGMFGGKDSEGSKVFIRLAITMGILLGIAKLASMMDTAALIKGELAVLGLVGIVAAMTLVAKHATKSEGVIRAVSTMMVGISAVLIMVAVLSMIPLDNMVPALAAVLSIIGMMSVLALAMSRMNKGGGVKGNAGGIVAMISSLVAIIAVSIVMAIIAKQPIGNIAAAATAIVGVIAAVALLAKAMSSFSKAKISAKSLIACGEALIMVAAMTAIVGSLSAWMSKLNVNPSTMLAAAGAISIALLGLVPVLLVLNKFNAYTGNKAGGGNYKKMITAVGGAIAALVVVAAAIGLLSRYGGDGNKMIQSAVAIAIGMVAVCAPIAILGAIGGLVKRVNVPAMVTVILGALAALGGVTTALLLLSTSANPDNLISSAQALAVGMFAMCVPIAVLGLVGQFCKTANPGVMMVALGGAIIAMAAVSDILVDFASRINPTMLQTLNDAIPILITAIGGISLIAIAISVAGAISGGNFAGVLAGGLAMVEAIGVLALVVIAISVFGAALNKINGLKKALVTGLDFMVIIAGKIGEAIGAFIGGIGIGLTETMIIMADNLVEFSERMIPFSENMQKVSEATVNGCKNLAAALLYITAAEFLDGIARWLGLGSKDFDFSSLGAAVTSFANEVSGLTEDSVKKAEICSQIALTLSQVSQGLDRQGGWVQKIIGQKDLGKFSENISAFGTAIRSFCESVTGLSTNSIELAQRASDTATPMVELSSTLTRSGGWVYKIIGKKNLGEFGTNMASFATGLIAFVTQLVALEAIAPDYGDKVRTCAEAMSPMVDLANGIQNSGGKLAKWVGENTLDVFGKTLVPFAEGFSKFVANLKIIEGFAPDYPELVAHCVVATQQLVNLANTLENMGGVKGFFSGDNTLKEFGNRLIPFGQAFQSFSLTMAQTDYGAVDSVLPSIRQLISVGNFASGVGPDAFNGLVLALNELSTLPISSISTEVVNGTPTLQAAYATMFQSLVNIVTNRIAADKPSYVSYGTNLAFGVRDGINRNVAFVMVAVYNLCNGVKTRLGDNMPASAFNVYGEHVGSGVATGIYTSASTASKAAGDLARYVASTLSSAFANDGSENYYKSCKTAGANVAIGLANGINEHANEAVAAAEEMARRVNAALPKALGERSPSKIAYGFGKLYDVGLGNGITDFSGVAVKSTEDMAEDIITTSNQIIDAIAAALDANVDDSPVIRPVLDTSDIEYKAANISKLFNSSDLALAYTASGTMKAIAPANVQNESVNSENGDDSISNSQQINFTQNNYSPKALNRYEIYRQTNNQIRQLKGVLG